MIQYIDRNYYSLYDLYDQLQNADANSPRPARPGTGLKTLMDAMDEDIWTSSDYSWKSSTRAQKCIDMLYSRYRFYIAGWLNAEDANATTLRNLAESVWIEIFERMDEVFERYDKILAAYDAKKSDLLNPLVSQTDHSQKHNDVPQTSGSFDSMDYGNSFDAMRTVSQNEIKTNMEKIEEIERLYSNVYKDWTDEFAELFAPSANLED